MRRVDFGAGSVAPNLSSTFLLAPVAHPGLSIAHNQVVVCIIYMYRMTLPEKSRYFSRMRVARLSASGLDCQGAPSVLPAGVLHL